MVFMSRFNKQKVFSFFVVVLLFNLCKIIKAKENDLSIITEYSTSLNDNDYYYKAQNAPNENLSIDLTDNITDGNNSIQNEIAKNSSVTVDATKSEEDSKNLDYFDSYPSIETTTTIASENNLVTKNSLYIIIEDTTNDHELTQSEEILTTSSPRFNEHEQNFHENENNKLVVTNSDDNSEIQSLSTQHAQHDYITDDDYPTSFNSIASENLENSEETVEATSDYPINEAITASLFEGEISNSTNEDRTSIDSTPQSILTNVITEPTPTEVSNNPITSTTFFESETSELPASNQSIIEIETATSIDEETKNKSSDLIDMSESTEMTHNFISSTKFFETETPELPTIREPITKEITFESIDGEEKGQSTDITSSNTLEEMEVTISARKTKTHSTTEVSLTYEENKIIPTTDPSDYEEKFEYISTTSQIFSTTPTQALTSHPIEVKISTTSSSVNFLEISNSSPKLEEIELPNDTKESQNETNIQNSEETVSSSIKMQSITLRPTQFINVHTPQNNYHTKNTMMFITNVRPSQLDTNTILIYLIVTSAVFFIVLAIVVAAYIVRRRKRIKTLRRPSHFDDSARLRSDRLNKKLAANNHKTGEMRALKHDLSIEDFNHKSHNKRLVDNYDTINSLDRSTTLQLMTFGERHRLKPQTSIDERNSASKVDERYISFSDYSPNEERKKANSAKRKDTKPSIIEVNESIENDLQTINNADNINDQDKSQKSARIPVSQGLSFILRQSKISNSPRQGVLSANDEYLYQLGFNRHKKRKSLSLVDLNNDNDDLQAQSLIDEKPVECLTYTKSGVF